jgi:hypothetical protein
VLLDICLPHHSACSNVTRRHYAHAAFPTVSQHQPWNEVSEGSLAMLTQASVLALPRTSRSCRTRKQRLKKKKKKKKGKEESASSMTRTASKRGRVQPQQAAQTSSRSHTNVSAGKTRTLTVCRERTPHTHTHPLLRVPHCATEEMLVLRIEVWRAKQQTAMLNTLHL